MASEHPIDAAGTPQKQQIYAVFDSDANAQAAEQDLRGMGITAQRLQGSGVAQELTGSHEAEGGLTSKFTRFFRGLGGEDHEAERYANHMEHGRVILAVPASDQVTAERITPVLTQHGAFDVTFFGSWTMQHLSPGENAEHGMPTYESSTRPDELTTGDVVTGRGTPLA